MDYQQELNNLLDAVIKDGASDLHLVVGKNPTLRVSGTLIPLVKKPVLTPEAARELVLVLVGDRKEEFLERNELDFSYSFKEKSRFRVNAYVERGFFAASLRLIPSSVQSLEELNLPSQLKEFALKEQGFFLVVGPNGNGKSTTLAALIDIINHERSEHIITIEDPIEYLFEPDRCIVSQREVRSDTKDFQTALKSMFRQDINIAMIGEMRDPETISAAVTAAETGHLIFSSLHTNSASQSVDRIIDSFPAGQQPQIRTQLAASLLGIFSQRLIPRVSGGLIPAYELMVVNEAVRTIIRDERTHELDLVIETGSGQGMVSLERSLADLVRRSEVSVEAAQAYSLNRKSFDILMQRRS